MLYPEPDDLTRNVSNRTRKIIGLISFLVSTGVAWLAYLSGDDIALVMSLVVGIPLLILSVSLLFGKGRKGKGILSPFTLYLIGTIVGLASIAELFFGDNRIGSGIFIALGCFALAAKRQTNKK